MAEKRLGRVTYFNPARGFGFITPEDAKKTLKDKPDSIWFHFTHLTGKDDSPLLPLLNAGQYESLRISFAPFKDDQGRAQAREVALYDEKDALRDLLKAGRHALTPGAIAQLSKVATGDEYEKIARSLIQDYKLSPKIWKDLETFCLAWERFRGKQNDEFARDLIGQIASWLNLTPLAAAAASPGSFIWTVHNNDSALRCFRKTEVVLLEIHLPGVRIDTADAARRTAPKHPSGFRLLISCQIGDGTEPIKTDSPDRRQIDLNFKELVELVFSSQNPDAKKLMLGKMLRQHLPYTKLQPFDVGVEHDERTFKGREQEKELILDSGAANIAIYGGRKFGKTWLAKNVEYICSTNAAYSQQFEPVYVSIQSSRNSDQGADQILEALQNRKMKFEWSQDKIGTLRKLLAKHQAESGKILFLMIDEVDNLISKGDVVLFEMLRQLQANYPGKFKYMLVGFKELFAAFSDDASNNPLANWISPNHRIALSFLTDSETQSLIHAPFRDIGFNPPEGPICIKIHEITGGHPYYIQHLCSAILQQAMAAKLDSISIELVDSIAAESIQGTLRDVYYANLSERQLLIGTLCANDESFSLEDVIQKLHPYSLNLDLKAVHSELRMMEATSVVRKAGAKYALVRSGIARQFFSSQDPDRLGIEILNKQK